MPSALHGRAYGMLKGMWAVDPALEGKVLRYRKSQKKLHISNPTFTQQIIEVCRFARDSGPGRLNLQVMFALIPRLPDPQLLVHILKQELIEEQKILTNHDAAEKFCANDGMRGGKILQKLASCSVQEQILICQRSLTRPSLFEMYAGRRLSTRVRSRPVIVAKCPSKKL